MDNKVKKICHGCKYINQQTASQHCYMFRDAPDRTCHQHSENTSRPLINSASEFAKAMGSGFIRTSEQ